MPQHMAVFLAALSTQALTLNTNTTMACIRRNAFLQGSVGADHHARWFARSKKRARLCAAKRFASRDQFLNKLDTFKGQKMDHSLLAYW